jgi:hypothetical protein
VVLVADQVGVIVLIMIHHLVEVMEDIVISEVLKVLVVVEVVHGIVMVDGEEVEVEEDLREFTVRVLAYLDKVTMEEIQQTSGVVLEEVVKVVRVDKWMKLVVEEVYVLIFQVMDLLNIVHKREEVLVEPIGIFKTHHSQEENMVDLVVEVVVPIVVSLQEVTKMLVQIEDKVVEVRVTVHVESQEMEVQVLSK